MRFNRGWAKIRSNFAIRAKLECNFDLNIYLCFVLSKIWNSIFYIDIKKSIIENFDLIEFNRILKFPFNYNNIRNIFQLFSLFIKFTYCFELLIVLELLSPTCIKKVDIKSIIWSKIKNNWILNRNRIANQNWKKIFNRLLWFDL